MPRGWQWDETLFQGSAAYYERGRIPYAAGLADAIAAALGLDGRGRLIDVGCGPGTIALRLAHLFEEIVGVDADAEMVAEAERQAALRGIGNARWVRALAEELPAGLGSFRAATFAQSFHWMERDRVAAAIFAMLEPGGAFIQVNAPTLNAKPAAADVFPYPLPPYTAVQELERGYLGPERRAGQGVLRYGTPDGEAAVLARAGFDNPEVLQVPGSAFVVRSIDDLVAARFSMSGSAPHLFGVRLPAFEAELR
ncbi:MAG: class I SAM-dependent methyltransferase, partial [Dehalococcoidia bacterium]